MSAIFSFSRRTPPWLPRPYRVTMTAPIVAPPALTVQTRVPKVTLIALSVATATLNATFLLFFVLWSKADEWAVDRSEVRGGFDPGQLLPHGGLMWVAAHAAFAALVVCDVLGVVVFVRVRKTGVARSRRVDETAANVN